MAVRFASLFMLLAMAGGRSIAQAPAAPPAAIAAAKAAMSDTANGQYLHVRLLTVGQGDLVFERYGHNLLWIIDTRTNHSVVWNWGVFDFAAPGFLKRFLFGDTQYMIDGGNAAEELRRYAADNREVTSQELALTPGQRAALDAFVRTNFQPENKFYRYDYYLDNCSTRLRDALDIVLDGAISKALSPRSSDATYRSETLRLNQHSGILFMGLDLALGAPADRPLSPWEYSFVPMRLRDELQQVQVPGPDGTPVPLAGAPRIIVEAKREVEPQAVESRGVRGIIVVGGFVLAMVTFALFRTAQKGSRGARRGLIAFGTSVHLILGLLASLVVFMWGFTLHAFWAWNPHLLLFTPISIAVAMVLPFADRHSGLALWVQRYHFTIAAIAFLVGVAAMASIGFARGAGTDMLIAWASASWMFHLAFGLALTRLEAGRSPNPDPTSSGMRLAA